MRSNSYRIIFTALMASVTCIATLLIHIPTPGTGGYINLGDGFVLMSALILPAPYALAAAGLGSALADLLSGYVLYAPVTLFVKSSAALLAHLLLQRSFTNRPRAALILSGAMASLVVVAGYFAFEATCLGYGRAALMSVPANALQGAVGVFIAVLLQSALSRSDALQAIRRKLYM